MVYTHIQNFINQSLENNKLSRKELAKKSNIPYSTLNELISGYKNNPTLDTVLKLANSLECSLDKILGNNFTGKNYNNISPHVANNNLRSFLKNYIVQNKMSPTKLSRNIGHSSGTIVNFINGKNNSIGVAILSKLSDILDISIDEMIGRTAPSKEKNISVEQSQSQTLDAKLTKDDLTTLKNLKSSPNISSKQLL